MPQINQLLIPCDSTIVAAYGSFGALAGACPLFDGSNNLILRVQPNSYKYLEDKKDEYIDGFASPFALVSTRRVGFEVTIADGRREIKSIIKALMRSITPDPPTGTVGTLLVKDYIEPEEEDIYTKGYTDRIGRFQGIESEAGTLMLDDTGVTGRRGTTGSLRLTFKESGRRSLY